MQSRPYRRRVLLPASVALVLVIQATGVALGLVGRPALAPAAIPPAATSARPIAAELERPSVRRADARSDRLAAHVPGPRPAPHAPPAPRVTTPTAQVAAAKSVTVDTSAPKPRSDTTGSGGSAYRGTNHVWIPSLGISRDVAFFPCSRTKPPGHQIYSWGCAGQNNVYLFGHAASVMKPLHDAYYSKRLTVGMQVIHADGNGRVSTYRVSYWKVVSPVDAGWAFAAQSRPSMTLQTCVGANSEWRLVVRLVRA